MSDKPRVLSAQTLAQTRIFHIEAVDLAFANGTRVTFERMRSTEQGAVLIVPVNANNEVLLIREYAAAMDRYELGLPKGKVETGEDILQAANREIMEEVGYGARQLRPLHAVTMAPGYLSHTTHIILATDLYPERRPGDEPEPLTVVPWSLDDLTGLLAHPEVTEARSIAALFLAKEELS